MDLEDEDEEEGDEDEAEGEEEEAVGFSCEFSPPIAVVGGLFSSEDIFVLIFCLASIIL